MRRREHLRAEDFERLFLDEMSPPSVDRSRGHIRACPACRAEYDRWARVEAELEPARGELSSLAIERGLARHLTATAERPPKSRSWRWGGALAACGASLALALAVLPANDGYLARGEASPHVAVSFRALEVQRGPEGVRLRDVASRPVVPEGASLKLLYTNLASAEALEVEWRRGDETRRAAPVLTLRDDVEDEPVPDLVRPPAEWTGPVELVVTFHGERTVERSLDLRIESAR